VGRRLDRLGEFLSRAARGQGGSRWIFAEDVESSVTYDECERLAELARGATVLEVGSYYGRSTIALASAAAVVHSIDPHDGAREGAPETLAVFLENLERYGVKNKVIVHVGLSTQLLPLLQHEVFDVVFVDAMHQRPEVDIDFSVAAPVLRVGGTMAFHDYGVDGVRVDDTWHPFEVTEAVDAIAAVPGVAIAVVDTLALVSLTHGLGDGAPKTWAEVCESLPDPYSVPPTPPPSPIGANTSST
jgi:predicted O-methyltransferase YrrM